MKESKILIRVCKGEVCFYCGATDSEPDPVFEGELLYWGYPLNADGTCSGDGCLYCIKAFNGQLKSRYGTLTKFKPHHKGEVKEERATWRSVCVEQVKAKGSTNASVRGGAADAMFALQLEKVSHKKQTYAGIKAPEDQVWDEALYIEKLGHWKTNGRGHTKGMPIVCCVSFMIIIIIHTSLLANLL